MMLVLSANITLRKTALLCRCYHQNTNNDERTKQQLQWAGTGAGRPGQHQEFMLCGRRVCSKAICVLVGFSPQTWTKRVRESGQEIHQERQHGNTVSIKDHMDIIVS